MKSVYSAVRTGSLNKAVCASSLKGLILTMLSEDGSRPPIVRRKYCLIRYIMYVQVVGCIIRNMYFCLKMDMLSGLLYALYLEALSSYFV